MASASLSGLSCKNLVRRALLLASSVILAGCVSHVPKPELLAAAAPKPETPSSVSGPLLDACVAQRSYPFGEPQIDKQALYHPAATYNLAERMSTSKIMAPYATRLRAYEAGQHSRSLFGKPVVSPLVCIYDLRDGKLSFLDALWLRPDRKIERQSVDYAVLRAYAIMAGKNQTKVILFGPYVK